MANKNGIRLLEKVSKTRASIVIHGAGRPRWYQSSRITASFPRPDKSAAQLPTSQRLASRALRRAIEIRRSSARFARVGQLDESSVREPEVEPTRCAVHCPASGANLGPTSARCAGPWPRWPRAWKPTRRRQCGAGSGGTRRRFERSLPEIVRAQIPCKWCALTVVSAVDPIAPFAI